MIELAKQIVDEHPELVEMEAEDRIAWFKIHGRLHGGGPETGSVGLWCRFRPLVPGKDLHTAGKVSAVIEELEKRG